MHVSYRNDRSPGGTSDEARARRALIVDADPEQRTRTRLCLKRLGLIVDVVDDGDAALAAVQRRAYDLLLAEVALPDMGGPELVRAVRAEPAGRELRILVHGSYALPGDARRATESGADAFLGGWTGDDALARAVRGLLAPMR